MKRIFFLFTTLLLVGLGGCSQEYDDSEVWDSIHALEVRMKAAEAVLRAYENNLMIASVVEIENGYLITFTDGSTATIINGRDGDDGSDGSDGSDGDALLDYIVVNENSVTFALTDGRIFEIMLQETLSIEFDSDDLLLMLAQQERHINYTVTSSSLDDVSVEVIASSDIQAYVCPDPMDEKRGYISICTMQHPDPLYSKVIVFVSNGEKVIMRRFSFSDYGIDVFDNSEKKAESEGGDLELEFVSSVEYEVLVPEEASDWIHYDAGDTRSELSYCSIRLRLDENPGYAREAHVSVHCPYDPIFFVDFHIRQKPNKAFVQKNDREALLDLYEALGGAQQPHAFLNWGSNAGLEEWQGVIVDEMSGRVLELSIDGGKGAVPSTIGNLTSLKKLHFNQSVITSLPKEIGMLSALEELVVVGVYNGKENLSFLPAEVGNLASLQKLILRCNNLEALPDSFSRLVNLEYLDLGFNYPLSGPALAYIFSLKKLKYIDLYYCSQLGGTLEGLSALTNLEYLNLGLTGVNGNIPSDIGKLSNLYYLSLMDTGISGSLPASISSLKKLRTLAVHWTGMSGPIPESIGELYNLEELLLEFTSISGNIPNSIGNCKKMETFSAVFTNLSGAIPPELGDIPALKYLKLSDCFLSGTLPASLANVSGDIWLYNNRLYGDIPQEILESENWRNYWGRITIGNNFNLEGITFPGPTFYIFEDKDSMNRFYVDSVYSKNRYTVLFQWGECSALGDAVRIVKNIYNKYSAKGLDVIAWSWAEANTDTMAREYGMPWKTYYQQQLFYPAYFVPTITVIDNNGMVIFSDQIRDRAELEQFMDEQYAKS